MTDDNALRNNWLAVSVQHFTHIAQLIIAIALVAIVAMVLLYKRQELAGLQAAAVQLKAETEKTQQDVKALNDSMLARLNELELTVYGTLEPTQKELARKKVTAVGSEVWVRNALEDLRKRMVAVEHWRLEQAKEAPRD